jgi:hypothetical protein
MKGWALAIIIILIIAAFGVLWYVRGNGPAPVTTGTGVEESSSTPPTPATTTPPATSDIVVSAPKAGDLVKSPVTIVGKARGTWFFEASFPIRIIDGNGRELGRMAASAQGDWMTTDFVPFAASLSFISPTTTTGTLILEKDNPSGLPANAAELRIPLRFK